MKNIPERYINRLLLDQIPDIVIVTDVKGKIVWVNKPFETLTGYQLSEVKGKVPGHFLQGESTDPDTIAIMRKAIKAHKAFHVNIQNYSKDGREYWLNIDCKPFYDPEDQEVEGFIAFERDVTTDMLSQQKVINKFISELQEATDRHEYMLKSLHMLSHDLKAPLKRIVGLLQLFEREKMNDMEQEAYELINKECKRLQTLNHKILSSQNQETEVEVALSRFDVAKEIKEVKQLFDKDAEAKNINFQFEANPKTLEVKLDRTLVHQIVENLISNAIKYTPEDKVIKVYTEMVNEEQFKICVEDHGFGISEWKLKHLFSPFQSFSDEEISKQLIKDKNKSTGIGLFIVKRYVDLMAGEIEVTSREGEGTLFTVVFPKDLDKVENLKHSA